MKDIAKIVELLVSQIDCTISTKYNTEAKKTYLCHTKWLRVGKIVSNSAGQKYRITDLVTDSYVIAKPLLDSYPPLDGIITIPVPFWITGTKVATNNEWTKADKNLMNKTPLAWLLETLSKEKFGLGDSRDFESEIRIFFLDETDVTNFYTADHREQVVQPMEELALGFIDAVDLNRQFKSVDNYKIITFSKFGVERSDGMFQNILDANLSGVELRITLTKFKGNCKC